MLAKNTYSGQFQHLISTIKKAADRRQETLVFKKTGHYNAVLNILVDTGFIKTYQETPTLLIIRLKSALHVHVVPAFVELHPVKRIKRRQAVHITDLIKLQRREGGAAYYVLNTDRGVMTSFDAIRQHLGGRILFRIA